jgi:hypothetical protein
VAPCPYQYPFVIDADARDRIPTEGVVTQTGPLEKLKRDLMDEEGG